ncbi:MAG: OmpA family protein [Proteobacteria bacterium]|nr:OmpA family protein [Pseudomonadota bacterium]MBU1388891.1 OmpA family protein [Pseudomonadota bacterium]MBU1543443.1 OmpA family protein [Pseudomonadota bacterium]MBU2431211.1 OmpA family protein [Pseudomonadota bacterium]MBU2480844.1 OmpA family protein [Pseudomonadota bacterium]
MKLDNDFMSPDAEDSEDFDYSSDQVLSYPPEKRNDKWSVSWSDLMMTMFIFFAVMYAFQSGNRDLLFGKGPGKNFYSDTGSQNVMNIGLDQNPSRVFDQARQAIAEVMVTNPDSVQLMKNGAVRIILAGDLLFDTGSADLKIGARYQLDQIARVLRESNFAINIVGHTDDVPSRSEQYPTNWELSSRRAVMVARYLTEVTGVDENRVFVSAHASHQAVAPNDTGRNRALNRRVEIILLKQMPYEVSTN